MLLKLSLAVLFAQSLLAADPFAVLTVYHGTWTINGKDTLVNRCTQGEAYYSCEQVVNGKPASLVVFTVADQPGRFHVQNVLPTGFATGRTDLLIAGAHWTYSNQEKEGGKTMWYRTENFFMGRDRIHFEQYQSSDGEHWEKKMEGDEVRSAPKR